MAGRLSARERMSFGQYRPRAEAAARKFLLSAPRGRYDEQALPSYTHANPLMRWLFWQRVKQVVKYFERQIPARSTVLDFGCGVGMLLPLLASRGYRVLGTDTDLDAAPEFLNHFGLSNHQLVPTQEMDRLNAESFDVITALDVLEHVEDLDGTIDQLTRLLVPGGRLLVCGPTENILYRLGRKLAGFKHHFHVRNIHDIRETFSKRMAIRDLATLYPFAPLFEIFVAHKAWHCSMARAA